MAIKGNIVKEYFDATPGLHNAIKTLRTNIRFSSLDSEVKTMVVTSTQPDEGKTTIAVFLGIAMAQAGQKTLIINCDTYMPFLAKLFGKRPTKSWIDYLYEKNTIEETAVSAGLDNLYVMDIEPNLASPVEIMGSNRFVNMVERLKQSFDFIIFDTPPLGVFIEAALLASKVDGTVLVISSNRTDGRKAQEVVEQLKKANARILGVVLNAVNLPDDEYYGHYDYQTKKNKS